VIPAGKSFRSEEINFGNLPLTLVFLLASSSSLRPHPFVLIPSPSSLRPAPIFQAAGVRYREIFDDVQAQARPTIAICNLKLNWQWEAGSGVAKPVDLR
jgi:hypothetical protein